MNNCSFNRLKLCSSGSISSRMAKRRSSNILLKSREQCKTFFGTLLQFWIQFEWMVFISLHAAAGNVFWWQVMQKQDIVYWQSSTDLINAQLQLRHWCGEKKNLFYHRTSKPGVLYGRDVMFFSNTSDTKPHHPLYGIWSLWLIQVCFQVYF